jgi:hypothetical protein
MDHAGVTHRPTEARSESKKRTICFSDSGSVARKLGVERQVIETPLTKKVDPAKRDDDLSRDGRFVEEPAFGERRVTQQNEWRTVVA